MFLIPVKYTENLPGIFQFTDVETKAKGKVPSEMIQKTVVTQNLMNENHTVSQKPGP